jgi:predicted metal-dependent hydrolase
MKPTKKSTPKPPTSGPCSPAELRAAVKKLENWPPKTGDRIGKVAIEDAFSYYLEPSGVHHEEFHMERAVRAISYLLDYHTDVGNYPLDGQIANGLAASLNCIAAKLTVSSKRPFLHVPAGMEEAVQSVQSGNVN